MSVQIFADGADKASILEVYRQPHIKGFTTDPTLMRAAGVRDYELFARDLWTVRYQRLGQVLGADHRSIARLCGGWRLAARTGPEVAHGLHRALKAEAEPHPDHKWRPLRP